ncbi:MAG: HD domain-containing protein [Planctomycetes bacterium]|nr:HD domain-containing protein [Planctomycetota bacterium]
MRATLHVVAGPDQGRLFSIGANPVTIGRNANNTIVINDVSISGVHSRIVPNALGGFTLLDSSSTNGTFVNGLEQKAADLKDGDEIQIGESVMCFHQQSRATILSADDSGKATVRAATPQETAPAFTFDPVSAGSVDRGLLEQAYTRSVLLERLDHALGQLETSQEILGAVVDAAIAGSGAQRGLILLLDAKSGELVPSVVRDLSGEEAMTFSKALATEALGLESVVAVGAGGYDGVDLPTICAPIISAGRCGGLLYVDSPLTGQFEVGASDTVAAIGSRAAASVVAARSQTDFDMLFSSMIDAIMRSIQAKDVYTRGHSERVRHYSKLLGKELGLSQDEVYRVSLGAGLHDIGKIGMPDSVLKFNKTPKLTEEQMKHVKHHPVRGGQILKDIPFLADIVPAAELHHEDWDGGGYPHGLKGEQIPLIARIVAVADTYDAITTDRPYQKGKSYEDGHEVLRKIAGKRLQPELVEAFISAFNKYRKRPSGSKRPKKGTLRFPNEPSKDLIEEITQTKPVAAQPKPVPQPAAQTPVGDDDLDIGLQSAIFIG